MARRIRFQQLEEARAAALARIARTEGDADVWLKRQAYGWLLCAGEPVKDGKGAIHFARRGDTTTTVTYPAGHPARIPA